MDEIIFMVSQSMKILDKCQVAIHVESNIIRYKINQSNGRLAFSRYGNLIEYHYQNFNDIDILVSQLQAKLPKYTKYEINLSDTYIQLTKLTRPDVKLQINEIALYIEASIYKLFGVSAKHVFYDFIFLADKQNQNQIMVAICERDYVNSWIRLFKENECVINFIGYTIDNKKFNFLPWRQSQYKKQKLYLSIVIVCLIGVMSCLFCYMWRQAHTKLTRYKTNVTHLQLIEQKLNEQLLNYLPNPSISQRQIHQSLILISLQLPSNIWLTSFNYELDNITIRGHSFNYIELTNFNLNLLQHKNVSKSQIKMIANNKSSLSFEMDIDLNE
ncbi:PilN domain-containing protein [Gilliamella sp. B2840]|uniref:PilN domain-containing protein n=1 Tax=Gilliamella sp. B2840 TaxID=2817975 RepID=UPI00226A1673|nr:PilN domain-containing protein [Gilliamella sp. B2840]MCX8700500.1 PilN domain-containing protein [Gilliamella sp. B2840]